MILDLHAPLSGQSVKLEIPETAKKIGVCISGGADSTILLYILCHHIKLLKLPYEVIPITHVFLERPIMVEGSFRAYNRVKELLNNDVPFLKEIIMYYPGRKILSFVRTAQRNLLKEGVVDIILNGMTTLPTDEEMQANNMWEDRPSNRGSDLQTRLVEPIFVEDPQYSVYSPFSQVDKRFVAEMYSTYNVEQELLPYTKSCITGFSKSKGWTTPCKTCWWCKERFWAFGKFDSERRSYMEEISDKVYSWNPPKYEDDVNAEKLKKKLQLKK